MVKIDLHIHSFYSPCSDLKFEEILSECIKKRIDGIAITDHNRIEGALYFKESFPLPTIIGEEIYTRQGHLNGLFLTKRIPPAMSLLETVKAIKEQGGLVYVPHPLDWTRKGLSIKDIMTILPEIDLIEVFNSRIWLPFIEKRIAVFAQEHNLIQCAASDAHSRNELGRAIFEIEHFPESASELKELAQRGKMTLIKKTPLYERDLKSLKARLEHLLRLPPNPK